MRDDSHFVFRQKLLGEDGSVRRGVVIVKVFFQTDDQLLPQALPLLQPELHVRKILVSHFLNPLKPELNPICYFLALLAHHFLHVSRIRVKSLTFRRLMSCIYIYIYMEHPFLMFLDHTQRRSTVGRTPLDE